MRSANAAGGTTHDSNAKMVTPMERGRRVRMRRPPVSRGFHKYSVPGRGIGPRDPWNFVAVTGVPLFRIELTPAAAVG
jgi:hypothetical protein